MIKTAESEEECTRVINVSSYANNFCNNLDLNDLNFVHDSTAGTLWAPFKIYGASKLCNILFSKELSNKLECHGESFIIPFFFS
jgi:NAD(P)-dependent dehydrogenase (short-subunit alcohol dehydrogenase family)